MTTSPQGSTQSADEQTKQHDQRVAVDDHQQAQNPETDSARRRDDISAGIDDDADRAARDPGGIDRIAEAQAKQANP